MKIFKILFQLANWQSIDLQFRINCDGKVSNVAREVIPIKELEKLGNEFQEVARKLIKCVEVATEAGMPAVLIHVKTLRNTHLPEVKDWAESTENDVRLEANAFREGRLSKAQKSVRRAESQKQAASEKSKKTDKKAKKP